MPVPPPAEEEESDEARLRRLSGDPLTVTKHDVAWLTLQVSAQRDAIRALKRQDGRFAGLREAAELVEAAHRKELKIRFMVGKREQAIRAVNAQLLFNVARLIRQYADEQNK